MPEIYEVEVVTGEAATVTSVPASSLEVEVHIESVATVGTIPVLETVEVIMPGPARIPDGSYVLNEGNAPGLMVLGPADPIPGGTPAGTIILRS